MTREAIALVLFAAFALVSGRMEAKTVRGRIARNDARNLNHAALTLLRGFALALLMLLAAPGWWLIPAMLAVFALAHRVAYNLTVGQPLDYMGPSVRDDNDSFYDTLMWSVSSYRVDEYPDGRRRYFVRSNQHPFLLACAFEVCVAAIFLLITYLTT